ncbi:hypothetical protein AMELA_G00074580 [Ameiurus melas]|uniref:Uncharacterized protein n=1 Tax=Ameiurus melas TaxID=219545 RepID=A0A7J6B0Q6_AMEME|nr:hypothetical protein AMELA_G00074580 [Ameiurus melas]
MMNFSNFTTRVPATDEAKRTAFWNYLPISALVHLLPGGTPCMANNMKERPEKECAFSSTKSNIHGKISSEDLLPSKHEEHFSFLSFFLCSACHSISFISLPQRK